jgi:hypothetical protein
MARTAAILRALGRALRRDQKSIAAVVGNNFFIVTVLVLQEAGAFLYLVLGLILLFTLSTDPLQKVPVSRLGLWPLERRERWILRASSPWVNPVTWLIGGAAVWVARGKVTVGLWGLCAGLVAASFVLSALPIAPRGGLWRRMPRFPEPLNHLIRKNLREMLSTLDFYVALLLSLAALAYRVWGPRLPEEALMPLTLLVVVALSSYAQCLFGLDGESGLERYRLLPVGGWQVLLAKDAAFLVLAVVVALPLAPLAGFGAALVALAVGHHATVKHQREQVRWRFSAGAPVVEGLVQCALIATAGSSVGHSAWMMAPCVAAWAGSVWWYGRLWDRLPEYGPAS